MEKVKKSPILWRIVEFLFITLGAIIAAFALEGILVPNTILDGGVTGISIILNLTLGWKLGLCIFFINIPFLFIGYKNLGTRFLIKAVYSIVMLAVFLELFHSVDPITDNILLATIYGSLLLGVGVGLVIRFGGCLDGTESLGIVISKNTNISVGQFVLFCNAIIFSVAGFFFGLDRALYSLLAYFITSKLVDEVSEGLEKAKAAMVICTDGDAMAKHIYSRIGRTCTLIKGNGLISGQKDVLYCVITRIEVSELRRIVDEEDQSAFITITDVSEVIGAHIKSNKPLRRRKKAN
jgi:uncharacterized membrane-anchored protein YitT (DUF2179 family)